jgi:phosphomannomutase
VTLIKSISGFRGTLGGVKGENLTPIDLVECTAAFGQWILESKRAPKVVIGRDGRISGKQVSSIVCNTLLLMGIDVIDLGLSTTPTVEIAVPKEEAGAGIILTASHNPENWNALKFLNESGEFISAEDGEELINKLANQDFNFIGSDAIGNYETRTDYIDIHIDQILNLPTVRTEAIKERKFHCIVDCINSTGAISIPILLQKLECSYTLINEDITGKFAHNPEPLPENLSELCEMVKEQNADLGIAVDPDVDRLVFVDENGVCFGEEYTLVAISDYILSENGGGNTVSNLSSTRALSDVTKKHGGKYYASSVGEVNVVKKMKEVNAIIGGEGNGGVILPELHYGRDALVGIALMLSHIITEDSSLSEIRNSYPVYEISKNKIPLNEELKLESIFEMLSKKYSNFPINREDGLKIDFDEGWVHMRKSNTEPIIRIYSESSSILKANELADLIKSNIEAYA